MILRDPELINLHGDPAAEQRDHISHSSLNTFLACEERYRWHYVERLEPTVTKSPLAMGRAFAHALELSDPEAGFAYLVDAAEDERAAAGGNPWIVLPSEKEVLTAATVVLAASGAYLGKYGAHQATREVTMRARIRNPAEGGRVSQSHDLLARVDALDLEAAELIEDKLTSRIDPKIAQRLRLDRQVSIGCYLTWRTTGVEIENVRYRITKKPGIKQTQKETHDEYLKRIVADYQERPDFYLFEEVVHRDRDDYLRLEAELWRWAESLRQAAASGVYPRNTASCLEWAGCSFLPLCAREPGASHQFRVREQRDSAPDATEVESSEGKAARAA